MLRGGDLTTHMDSYNERESTVTELTTSDPDDDIERQPLSPTDNSAPGLSNQDILLRLYQLAKPERNWILLSALTLVFTSIVQLTTPYLSGYTIDVALQQANQGVDASGNDSSPAFLLMILFVVVAFAAYLTYLRQIWQARAGQRLVARLRRLLFGAIMSQDASFFDSVKTGDLLNRLTSDAQLVQSAVQDSVLTGMRSFVMSTGAAIMLLWTSWSLALVSLTILPPTMTIARTMGRKMREKHQAVQNLLAQATSTAEQALTNIVTVQQFANEPHEADQYNAKVHDAHYEAMATARLQAAFSGMVQIVGNGSMLCVLGYGGTLVASGSMSAGALAGFVMYSLIMAGNVSGLTNVYADLMKAVAAMSRIIEIVDRTPSIPPPRLTVDSVNETLSRPSYVPSRRAYHHQMTALTRQSSVKEKRQRQVSIDFRNVSFQYPARRDTLVLGPHFSLSILPGEVLALVGSSGAGKSTVASLLTRLYDATEGAIYLDGIPIPQLTPHQLRQQVGVVSQEPMLFPTTIRENIRYGRLDATDKAVLHAARLANVLDFADTFPNQLETLVGPRGTQLSGGQKQRVAIARAILKDPPILIFDEATSALDAQSEQIVQQAVNVARKGRTVLSIAHRLSTIRAADRVAVLSDGQVAEIGTFDELVAKETGPFRELMERQLLGE